MRLLRASLLLLAPLALAQKPSPKPESQEHTPELRERTTALPVTRVSLYKNGVGFFEHTGSVTGNAAVTIDFTSGQLNDVLQSLTAIDLNGGRIAGAGYNSTTPLDQQLKTLPISLAEDATSADFYAAIRGARIEVTGSGPAITGRLLSIEVRNATTDADAKPLPERHFLTVVSDTGEVRTLELIPTTSVHLLDTALHTDVSRYLQLLDSNRSQGLRHLTLQDNGTGTRQLQLSYISEVPIWKSTYRILFTDKTHSHDLGCKSTSSYDKKTDVGKVSNDCVDGGPAATAPSGDTATLQGWSVVDNTTGTDWLNVHLSLIAGAPQSFIQPLSDPIYSRRPEIPIAQEAQLTPQTHDSSIEEGGKADRFSGGGGLEGLAGMRPGVMAPKMAMKGRSMGYMGGMAGGAGSANATVTVEAAPPPVTYEDSAEASITPTTTTAAFDDFFSYNLTEPVTILKNTSALVPILQTKLPAERVTLVSSDGINTSQPLRALWITNTSGLTLDRGSFSIVEDGNFGGEGLLDPIHPGEKRLLSYAADEAVHVTTEDPSNSSHITSITAAKGTLTLHRADAQEVTYVLHNAAADARTIVLEQPVEKGLKLDATPAPDETTATVYRFRIEAAPGETKRLHLAGKRNQLTVYQLTQSDDDQLTLILNQTHHNPALESALQPILAARRQVSDAQTAVNQTTTRLTALRADEDRQRANITALANADKNSRDRFVRDLNTTEDAITAAQKELSTRTATLDAAKSTLANSIESLQLDIDTAS
jgi:hypothetical protein